MACGGAPGGVGGLRRTVNPTAGPGVGGVKVNGVSRSPRLPIVTKALLIWVNAMLCT